VETVHGKRGRQEGGRKAGDKREGNRRVQEGMGVCLQHLGGIIGPGHVGSMQHLSYTLVYILTRVVDQADVKTLPTRHNINVVMRCQCYQNVKMFGTEVVQKGTEVDLVVVPKMTC